MTTYPLPAVASALAAIDRLMRDDRHNKNVKPFWGFRYGLVGYYNAISKFAAGFCDWADRHISRSDPSKAWPCHINDHIGSAIQEVCAETGAQIDDMLKKADPKDFKRIARKIPGVVLRRKPLPIVPTPLEGFAAAFICIDDMVATRQKSRPTKLTLAQTKSAAYRAGEFSGLVMAKAMGALGTFPDGNADEIRKIQKRVAEKKAKA